MADRGWVRIIGGEFRGKKIKVPEIPDLRPTPDRVRETLFNWLAPKIHGAYCLDGFAGSGALGFEALSRGAAHVVMIDQSKDVVKVLREQISSEHLEIYQAKAPEDIKPPQKVFDIVFLDPPFQQNLLLPSCFYLEEKNYLAENAFIYLESSEEVKQSDLPKNWELLKSKKAGTVFYHLARRI